MQTMTTTWIVWRLDREVYVHSNFVAIYLQIIVCKKSILALDSQNGEIIWIGEKDHQVQSAVAFNMYTVNSVQDVDGDHISDIMTVHIIESELSNLRRIKFISGASGKLLRTVPTPSSEMVLVPLQVLTYEDGTQNLLVITGGQGSPGGLYTIRLAQLLKKSSEVGMLCCKKILVLTLLILNSSGNTLHCIKRSSPASWCQLF